MKKCIAFLFVGMMLLSMVAVSAEVAHVSVYADPTAPTSITVDGEITSEEWGEPVARYTYRDVANLQSGWTVWRYFGSSEDFKDQAVELYTRRDAENLYFGYRFVNIHHIDYAYIGENPQHHPCMKMVIGAFDAQANIETEQVGEEARAKWLSYTLRPRYDEAADRFITEIEAGGSLDVGDYLLPNGAVYVNEEDNSYHYEIVLPYKDLYGVITAQTEDLVLAFQMNDAYVAGSDSANRWFVSEAVRLAGQDKGPQVFLEKNPIRLIYAQKPTPQATETPAEPPPILLWCIPIIAAVAVLVAVIVIRKTKKEKQR